MRVVVMIMLALLVFGGCGQKVEKAETKPEPRAQSDEQLLQEASEKLIMDFMGEMKGELMKAVSEGGMAGAIKVCKEMAPAVMARYAEHPGWSIKRVTDKPRNPGHMVDSIQREVLAKFATADPEHKDCIGTWMDAGTGKTYHYFKPIAMDGMCTKCHGTAEAMDPDVAMMLPEFYPEDQATGYEVGDLRGMFVVEISWPEGEPYARELVGETAETHTGEH